MTISIKHSLNFTTEVDETHPVGKTLLRLSEIDQTRLLGSMLKDLLAPTIIPALELLNKSGTYAILKLDN
jgi:hypothetical protein